MRLKVITVQLIFLLILPFSLFAFDWPVSKVILTSNFCESRKDHFHTGIDIGGGAQKVYPISSGDAVFIHRTEDFTSIPIGLGNFIVLQHSSNIRSVYCHLKDKSVGDVNKVDRENVIGIIGDTGHSFGKHLHLSIIDMETNAYLNPLSILPGLKDSQPPIIKRIYIQAVSDEKKDKIREVKRAVHITESEVRILAEIYDLREDVSFIWKMAPYRVTLYENGSTKYDFTFDSVIKKGNKLVLSGTDIDFNLIYYSEWIYNLGLIKLPVGETRITIVAGDFNGNDSSREISITVKK